jgi:hypothetical protein
MKKTVIISAIIMALGFLLALGPQFLFKVCDSGMSSSESASSASADDDCCAEPEQNSCCGPEASSLSICYWSARAEIGIGLLIVALGACMIVFTDPKTHLGLLIGIFLASIIALSIPNTLIGGCSVMTMQCRKVAFPTLTAESVVLLVFSAIMITVIAMRKPPVETVGNVESIRHEK